ncbi:hypothetical protein [Stenotrophomonas indicatrix]|uniref:hypothetical protein n=1 Tax=Stenotrophomonas indicatrix TaxID=2045451 RepID=UPI003442A997
MTPEQLIKQRKQRELLAKASQAKTTGPSDDEKIVSDATKENLKTAGRLAASFSKALAEKTKHAAALAADKGREAQEAMARRAEEAKARKEAEAAEQARKEAESAQAEQQATAQPELLVVEAEPAQPNPTSPLSESAFETVASYVEPEPTQTPEPNPAPVVVEPVSLPTPAVSEAVEATHPAPAPVEPKPSLVPNPARSKPDQAPVSAPKPTSTRAPSKPQAAKASAAKPTADASAKHSNTRGWQVLAGAGVAVLVLGGAFAWWIAHRSSEAVPPQAKPAAAVTAPAQVSEPTPPVVSETPQVEAPEPVPAPVEEKAPVVVPVVEAPTPAVRPMVEAPASAEVKRPTPVLKPALKPVAKPKLSQAPKPVANPEPKNDWQDQANDDIDAWAKKNK